MDLNMLRIMVFITSIVWLAGCTTVIDRGKLEADISLEEEQKPASIDIVARCEFGQVSVETNRANATLATCVFMDNRVNVYTQGFFSDKIEKQTSIKYADIKSVTLYKSGKMSQLQIDGMSGYFVFGMTNSNGVFYDQEMSERVYKHMLAKGVAEQQSENQIIMQFNTVFFIPIPNALIVPFLW